MTKENKSTRHSVLDPESSKKVLVIGGGGREQALAWKLLQSSRVEKVYVAPGNGGSDGAIENVDINWTDVKGLLNFAKEEKIDLTVIGQEAASEAGVVDAFAAAGLTIFGVDRAAVQLESSKVFSKNLMKKAKVPTATYKTFSDPVEAAKYAKSRPLPVVIKADGLAEGKGVVIAESPEQIDAAINEIMVEKKFGQSGAQVVVEDFLTGQEVSTHALCDGRNFVLFPPSQDHKQIYDGDKGPNTGGMGVIAPVPWVTPGQMQIVAEKVIAPTLKELERANVKFVGCLYPGLMIDSVRHSGLDPESSNCDCHPSKNCDCHPLETRDCHPLETRDCHPELVSGSNNCDVIASSAKQSMDRHGNKLPRDDGQDIKVLEFNARFGDPEAEVYMRLFDGDLYEVMSSCAEGKLDTGTVKWKEGFAVSVVMASVGYPGKYEKGLPIAGLDEAAKMPDIVIFHAGTKRDGDKILTAGGRVLNVTATGKTLDEALEKAYKAVDKIHFDGAQFRRDIGRRTR